MQARQVQARQVQARQVQARQVQARQVQACGEQAVCVGIMVLRARIQKNFSNGALGQSTDKEGEQHSWALSHPSTQRLRVRLFQAVPIFLLGFITCLLLEWPGYLSTPLPSVVPPGGHVAAGLPPSSRPCHRRTKAGMCVDEVFDAADAAYSHLWPGGVDLLIRSYMSDKFFLLGLLLHSVELMWPKGIGDVVLVLDQGNTMALDMVPSWVKVVFEVNHLQLPGKILQQWSYGWADNYTTAAFVAIVDDDVVFSLKVTPPLLFNLSTGRPYIIASNRSQEDNWLPSTQFFVGPADYFANFMVQLPFLVPRGVFAAFREHVGRSHPQLGGTYDAAMKWFAANGPGGVKRTQIQHTALGNFMHKYTPDAAEWVYEWSNRVPIPRVGVHLPYANAFRVATNHIDGIPRVTALYAELAGHFAHEGVCHSFPPGHLPNCKEVLKFQQKQIWMYALDWSDWSQLFQNRSSSATGMYDKHRAQMHCLYSALAQVNRESDLGRMSRDKLVLFLRQKCLN